jgi:hypothetical protein
MGLLAELSRLDRLLGEAHGRIQMKTAAGAVSIGRGFLNNRQRKA